MQTPPPRRLPPTRTYPQDSNAPDSSAIPPSSIGSIQQLPVTLSGLVDQRRPVSTPSGPSPVQRPVSVSFGPSPVRYPVSVSLVQSPARHPVSVSSNLSSPKHLGSSITTRTTSSSRSQQSQQSPHISQRSNQPLGQTRSNRAPDQHQAYPLSRESLTIQSPRHNNARVSHQTTSIPPIPSRPPVGGLDLQLATISARDSRLTQSRTFSLNMSVSANSELRAQNSIMWFLKSDKTGGTSEKCQISGSCTQKSR